MLTDRLDMTLAVAWAVKPQHKQTSPESLSRGTAKFTKRHVCISKIQMSLRIRAVALSFRYPSEEAALSAASECRWEEWSYCLRRAHISFCRFCCASAHIIEPPHDKTNKMTCAPSEDSYQPGHPSSLIRVFTVRTDLSLRWAQRSFCHAAAHI